MRTKLVFLLMLSLSSVLFAAYFLPRASTADTAPPAWSNAGTNSTVAGQSTLFYVRWTDDSGLSGFIFGCNNTGRWANDTWTQMGGTVNWSNVTQTINGTATHVEWRVWANDTSNNWNNTGILKVLSYPVASFDYSPTFPAAKQVIAFDASGSHDPDGHVVSYVWNFGDGNVTSVTSPIIHHKYANVGNYTVRLTVSDNEGLTDTSSKEIAVNNPPLANFQYLPELPYVGDQVAFNASQSTAGNNTIVCYVWDFGDGSATLNTTSITGTHIYTNVGNFTVRLTIKDDQGLTNTASKPIFIQKAPVAIFTYEPTQPQAFTTIFFNASQSHDPNGYIVSHVWDFGDGNVTTVTTSTIAHYYQQAANYSVVLIVSDNNGYTDSAAATLTVSPRPPTANFTYTPDFPIAGQTALFNASKSYDMDGNIVTYLWSFGDGNVTSVSIPTTSHVYTSYGNYAVMLKVTDNDGLTCNKTASIRARGYPTANFTSPSLSAVNGSTTFDASWSLPNGGTISLYSWDFGDGTRLNSTDPFATHVYSSIGNYTATLMAVDTEDLTNTTSKVVQIKQKPIPLFTYSPSSPYRGDTVTFNASSSYDPDGTVTSYIWDFGDGSPTVNTTNPVIIYIYDNTGNYMVILTVVDDVGLINTTIGLVNVGKTPIAFFTYSPASPIAGNNVLFNASGSYCASRPIANYSWNFGDGNVTTTSTPTLTHTFTVEGNYTVVLSVTDTGGYSDTTIGIVNVRNYPVVNFVTSPTYPIRNESTMFDASLSDPRGGTMVNYNWNFGDGTRLNTTASTAIHTFSAIGQYNVTLTVTDSEGLTNAVTKTVLVRDYPTSSFTWSPTSPMARATVTFNGSASRANSGTIVNYSWNFGDGNTTGASTPIIYHAYSQGGYYNVTLTVTNSDGLAKSTTKAITVLSVPPVASFNIFPSVQAKNRSVTFDASSSYDPDGYIAYYVWNFGDGNITLLPMSIVKHRYEATGNYTVALTVTDGHGLSNSTSKVAEICLPPEANFTHQPTEPFVGETVTFNASSSYDPDGYLASYTWNFGDGNILSTPNSTITHVYTSGRDCPVILTVRDNKGLTDMIIITLHVKGYPIADFTVTPEPIARQASTFNASASSPNGGTIVRYMWDFGDGTQMNSTYPTTSHAYSAYGNFTVTLTVIDSDNLAGTVTKMTRVREYPTASFSYSPSPPQRKVAAKFNATLSTPRGGTIVNYIWNFGDGNVTTVTTLIITHAFKETGLYSVKLTVVDSESLNASVTKATVVVKANPVAFFTFTPGKPRKGESATFNASQSYDPDGYVYSYSWDLGDGTTVNTTYPIIYHPFNSAGTFAVKLTVKDAEGYTGSNTRNVTAIAYPTAAFTWSPYPYAKVSETVTFDASSSLPGSGTITDYLWSFGDGNTTTTTAPVITHAFTNVGLHTVTLTVSNSDGLSRIVSHQVDVCGTPYADFFWSPSGPLVYQPTTFNASASKPNGSSIVSYTWAFGDGSSPTTRTSPTIVHQFVTYGTYDVTLTVKNSAGLMGTISKSVVVLAQPISQFIWTPASPYAYDSVTFDASSSLPGSGTITSHVWDFGDGNRTSTTNPIVTHCYTAAGAYTVSLNVTNSDGLFNATSKIVNVVAAISPTAAFTFSPFLPGVYETVLFNASSSVARGGTITGYMWAFGDGNVAVTTSSIVYHVYQTSGNYTVALNVTNSAGYSGTVTKHVWVVPISGPSAGFTWSPTLPYFNQTAQFDASTSTPGWNGTAHPLIVSYGWSFGDGNITATSLSTVSHKYVKKGNYTVTLTVTDVNGGTGNLTKTITVSGLVGDVNGDGKVDIQDIAKVSAAYGSIRVNDPADPRYGQYWHPVACSTCPHTPNADVNGDGRVDIQDLSRTSANFGQHT